MGKNCGAKNCTGASQTASSPPGPPKTNRGSGSRKMDSASVDTIDRPASKTASARGSSTGCPPGCDPGVTTCPPSPSKSSQGPKKSPTVDKSSSCQESCQSPSGLDDSFMDLLINFMERSHEVIRNYKETSGSKNYSISHTERTVRIQELQSLIEQKEEELAALEEEQAALDAGNQSGMSAYQQAPVSRMDYAGETDFGCAAGCTGPGDMYGGFVSDGSDAPGDTSFGYQMYDASVGDMLLNSGFQSGQGLSDTPDMCEEECQSEYADTAGDILNTGFIDDSSCDPQCLDPYSSNNASIGDMLNTGFIDYGSQQYAPQQYAPQQYAPQQYASRGTAGKSASSCFCPSDGQAARYGRKR